MNVFRGVGLNIWFLTDYIKAVVVVVLLYRPTGFFILKHRYGDRHTYACAAESYIIKIIFVTGFEKSHLPPAITNI